MLQCTLVFSVICRAICRGTVLVWIYTIEKESDCNQECLVYFIHLHQWNVTQKENIDSFISHAIMMPLEMSDKHNFKKQCRMFLRWGIDTIHKVHPKIISFQSCNLRVSNKSFKVRALSDLGISMEITSKASPAFILIIDS